MSYVEHSVEFRLASKAGVCWVYDDNPTIL